MRVVVPRPGARRVAQRALSMVVLLLAVSGAAATAAVPPVPSEQREEVASIQEVERILASQLDEAGIAGGAVAVVSARGIEAAAVGAARDDRDATADAPFVIGSATKSFTALAVMQLVEDGLVDLDAPVHDYVPELELAAGQPVGDITVRSLLEQTSGLDDLTGGPLLASAADGTPLAAVAELADSELGAEPGTTWRYANVNYVLAGLIVERASGLSYGDYVQRNIFAPLGMTHSSATTEPVDGTVLAEGQRFWFGVPVVTEPVRRDATLAAGYLVSTAGDLGRYLSMYLAEGLAPDGARLISADGVRALLAEGPDATLGSWAGGAESRYAMGWFVGGPWGETATFHPGNTPDTTTMLALLPDLDLAVAVVAGAGNELPVPGNPFIADRVTRNVVHAAAGQPVLDLPSVWRFYALFDLVVLLLLAAGAWDVLRGAGRARGRVQPRHRALGWAGVLVRALGVAVLILIPTSVVGWGGLWTWTPDLAVAIATLTVLLAVAATLRAVGLLRSRRAAGGPVIPATDEDSHDAAPQDRAPHEAIPT